MLVPVLLAVAGIGCEAPLQPPAGCDPMNDACPPERHCDAMTRQCADGCRADDGCAGADGGAGRRCDPKRHACVECADDAHCPFGALCMGNVCVKGCSAQKPCPLTFECCGGGCVDPRTNAAHCGACGTACAPAHAIGFCRDGACGLARCDAGFGDCDRLETNGCETDLSANADHCGACGRACRPPNASGTCVGGACVAACNAGFGDCDRNAGNGCEAALSVDVLHCGACGMACPAPANAIPACVAARCLWSCAAGWLDCDRDARDGCEIDVTTDVMNCGGCGVACALGRATATCDKGQCAVAACDKGFADCNGVAKDGCEVDLSSDGKNCNACGMACALPNAVAACALGQCTLASCVPGFADCNRSPADGCEQDLLVDPKHCGACGNACNYPNAQALCLNGGCRLGVCAAGFADCNMNAADGCEVVPATDVRHCGGCGRACVSPNATPSCQMGACGIAACNLGWTNTNGRADDGCEDDKVIPAAAMSRFAGAGNADWQTPSETISLAVGPMGNLYVLSYNDKVIVFDRNGTYLRKYPKNGWTTAWGIAVDPASGEMWIADTDANRVLHLRSDGTPAEIWGGVTGPRGIEFARGEVYVGDYGGNRVLVFGPTGNLLRTLAGSGMLNKPRGLDVDAAGNVYVANEGTHSVVVLSPAGNFLRAFATCAGPADVAWDENIGRIYVVCETGDEWNAYRPDGTRLFGASTQGAIPHNGIDTGPDGRTLYVAFVHYANRGVQIYRY